MRILLALLFISGSTQAGVSLFNGLCTAHSCENNGVCRRVDSELHFCRCDSAHYGPRCEHSRCDKQCRNEGICVQNGKGDFRCQCQPGFTGTVCERELASICTRTRPCGQHGQCRLLSAFDKKLDPTGRGYRCACDQGWTGATCSVREESCDGQALTCLNGGHCLRVGSAVSCDCPSGWEGHLCETPTDTCDILRPCTNGGACVNTNGGGFHCSCSEGFAGEMCEVSLLSTSGCSPDPTSARACDNDGYCMANGTCECPSGWTGDRCEVDQEECTFHPCKNNGMCEERSGTFICHCLAGFHGARCELERDACSGNACASGSECVPMSSGGYECRCPFGKTGAYCNSSRPCDAGSCGHGFCGDNGCVCDEGWTGPRCLDDMDECALRPCVQGACLNEEGSFRCLCPDGKTGKYCELSIPTCANGGMTKACCEERGGCRNGGVCMEDGSCQCTHGWMGHRCEASDLCKESSCPSHEICTPDAALPRGFKCSCPPGFYGERCSRRYLELESDHCSSSPCLHGGSCISEMNGFVCHCPHSHYGSRCERERQPCAGNMCDNGAHCQPSENYRNYTCECARGFSGRFCEKDIDECADSPCMNGGTCANSHGSFVCVCPPGYEGRYCARNTDECKNAPCHNGGTCIDGINDFTCACPSGFTGKLCSVNVDDCAEKPCQNGGLCRDSINTYTCECRAGFTGHDCETNIDDCRPGLCLNGGSCIDGVADFRCECAWGFAGKRCEQWIDLDKFNHTDKVDYDSCVRSGCSLTNGDGICDPACNHYACGFDGGDCSAKTQPFQRCKYASYCAHVWGDGKCDDVCNNEACLFDGFDCRSSARRCPETRRDFCRDHFADGVCDEQCDLEECGWDGGDCERGAAATKNDTRRSSNVKLVLLMEPWLFVAKVQEYLLTLSEKLRASVRVKLSVEGPEAFEWTVDGPGKRLEFPKETQLWAEFPVRAARSVPPQSLKGVIVELEIDITECRIECFSDANAVAAFIGASYTELAQVGMPVFSAEAVRSDLPNDNGASNTTALVVAVVLAVFIVGIAILGVQRHFQPEPSRKRKVIEAPTYWPVTSAKLESSQSRNSYYPANSFHPYGYDACDEKKPRVEGAIPVEKKPEIIEQPRDSTALELAVLSDYRIPPDLDVRSLVAISGRFGRTALHWLAMSDKKSAEAMADLETLHRAGVVLDAVDTDGCTALHYAARNGRFKMAQRLLELNAHPLIQDHKEMTPLHVAAMHFDDKIIELLLQNDDVKENVDVLDTEDRTALMLYAAYSEHSVRGAQLLIGAGADVNCAGDKKRGERYRGMTPLHHAAAGDIKTNHEMIPFLISQNANKDAQDVKDATPLWLAVSRRNVLAVRLLLEAGASLDFQDQTDKTPIDIAAEKKFDEIQEMLLQAKARSCSHQLFSGPHCFPPFRQTALLPPPMAAMHRPAIKPALPKRPLIKKPKSPPTPPASSSTSGYSTTPSPPGTKAAPAVLTVERVSSAGHSHSSHSSGGSFMDSPRSDHAGHGVHAGPNTSSEFSSPTYTPNYQSNTLPWDMAASTSAGPFPSSSHTNPSPPYDDYASQSFSSSVYPFVPPPPSFTLSSLRVCRCGAAQQSLSVHPSPFPPEPCQCGAQQQQFAAPFDVNA